MSVSKPLFFLTKHKSRLISPERPSANGNSIPNSFWMIAEIIRDPALLCDVRFIVDSCCINSALSELEFDFVKLCDEPLLQSVYAKTLRLHVASFLFRGPDRKEFNLKGWCIPRDAVILVSSFNAQMDPAIWSTRDERHCHPIDHFWAQRFLEDTKEGSRSTDPPFSKTSVDGSSLEPPGIPSSKATSRDGTPPSTPVFSLKGRSGAWIPYGGGQRMCPGRHFAKQEMISSLAIMLTLFDIELVDKMGNIPENDMAGFGFGALWPKQEMPVRMRQGRADRCTRKGGRR